MRVSLAALLLVLLGAAACGGASPSASGDRASGDRTSDTSAPGDRASDAGPSGGRTSRARASASRTGEPFGAAEDFTPVAFTVAVQGTGRPVILIPGLGCPGAVWDDTVRHLGDGYQTHVLTLAGFAGNAAIDEPLSAAVRRDLTRYIRSRGLRDPIIFGHSMGGFIAYWIASYHPELVGPVIVVDAGPALSGDLDEAKALRARWKNASDAQFHAGMRAAFSQMTAVPRKMAPVIAQVIRSDRKAIGNAIYEMVTTNLTAQVQHITAPVLVIAADGGYQTRIRAQIKTIPDHEMIVLRRARHFVMFDDPRGYYGAIDRFLAAHPPPA